MNSEEYMSISIGFQRDGNPGDDTLSAVISQSIWKLFSWMEFGSNYRNSIRDPFPDR